MADPSGGFEIVNILVGLSQSKYFSYINLHHFESTLWHIFHTKFAPKAKFLLKRYWILAPPFIQSTAMFCTDQWYLFLIIHVSFPKEFLIIFSISSTTDFGALRTTKKLFRMVAKTVLINMMCPANDNHLAFHTKIPDFNLSMTFPPYEILFSHTKKGIPKYVQGNSAN